MLNPQPTESPGTPTLPLLAAADLQDNLMTATHDLDRLQALLAHACDELMAGFHGASVQIRAYAEQPSHEEPTLQMLADVLKHLGAAITALQFQDMGSQLINHTNQRLRNCADRIAREAMGDGDEDGFSVVEAPPLRPNPVTQDEMDAGSVELF
jgi:hypothetical protein